MKLPKISRSCSVLAMLCSSFALALDESPVADCSDNSEYGLLETMEQFLVFNAARKICDKQALVKTKRLPSWNESYFSEQLNDENFRLVSGFEGDDIASRDGEYSLSGDNVTISGSRRHLDADDRSPAQLDKLDTYTNLQRNVD